MSVAATNAPDLLAAFRQGEEAAADPENQEVTGGGRALTTLRSRWLHLRCEVCEHTFRVGDAVEVGPDRKVRHASAELPCSGATFSRVAHSTDAATFYSGLDESWPPPPNLPVRRLEPGTQAGDLLLAPAVSGFQRHRCAICGHTLRPYDQVVICPCRPDKPMCILSIHRDPIHGLNCWEAWNPGQVQQYCPATSRKLHEQPL